MSAITIFHQQSYSVQSSAWATSIFWGGYDKRLRTGDAFAQFELGLDLDFGTLGEQNFEKAADYLTKAADQGHQSAEGNLLLQHVLGQAKTYQPDVVFARLKSRAESGIARHRITLVSVSSSDTAPRRITGRLRLGFVGPLKVA